jgi:hypothetical protein
MLDDQSILPDSLTAGRAALTAFQKIGVSGKTARATATAYAIKNRLQEK